MMDPYVVRNRSLRGEAVKDGAQTERDVVRGMLGNCLSSDLTSFGERACVHALIMHRRLVGDNFPVGVIAVPAAALRAAKRARISWLSF